MLYYSEARKEHLAFVITAPDKAYMIEFEVAFHEKPGQDLIGADSWM